MSLKIVTAALLAAAAIASPAAADDGDGGGPRQDPMVLWLRSILGQGDGFQRGYWDDGRFRTDQYRRYRYVTGDDDDDDGGRGWRSGDDDD